MRGALRQCIRPPVLGALYVLALTALFGAGANETEALGKNAHSILDFVHQNFGGDLFRLRTAIALFAVAVGLLLGTVGGLAVEARRTLRDLSPAPRDSWHALLLTALLHAALMLWGMATWPALYAPLFYERGGARRQLQILATDLLGPLGCLALFVGLPILFVVFPFRSLGRSAIGKAWHSLAGGSALIVATVTWLTWRPTPTPPQRSHESTEAVPPRNVLILAADSLRADRFNREHMPRTFAFAERGTVFDNAYVSLPRTFPSWTTLLTGRYPHHHGIRSMFPTWEARAKDFDAMPARFSKSGARSIVVSDFAGDIFSRIPLGFDHVDAPIFNVPEFIGFRAFERSLPVMPFLHTYPGRRLFPSVRELHTTPDPSDVVDRARVALSSLPASRSFFLTAFFSTTHFPYAAPAPFYKTSDGYSGDQRFGKLVGLEGASTQPTAADAAHVRALYDGAVRSVDNAMADLLFWMDERDLLKDTVVVITADHGETIYENDRGLGHGDHLFGDEVVHVPLAIIGAGARANTHVTTHVRDVDLAPTLYELTHNAPPADLDGLSVVPALKGGPLLDRDVFAETGLWFTERVPGLDPTLRLPYPPVERATEVDAEHGGEMVLTADLAPLTIVAKHRMLLRGKYKLIYIPTPAGPRYQLFDVEADPHNTHDLADRLPREAESLQKPLMDWIESDPALVRANNRLVYRDHPPVAAARGLRLEAK